MFMWGWHLPLKMPPLKIILENFYIAKTAFILIWNVRIKNNKTFQVAEITETSLTHPQATVTRDQMKQWAATILCHKSKLTGGMCLLGFWWVCFLCTCNFLYLPLGSSFSCWNHIKALVFQTNTFHIQTLFKLSTALL